MLVHSGLLTGRGGSAPSSFCFDTRAKSHDRYKHEPAYQMQTLGSTLQGFGESEIQV